MALDSSNLGKDYPGLFKDLPVAEKPQPQYSVEFVIQHIDDVNPEHIEAALEEVLALLRVIRDYQALTKDDYFNDDAEAIAEANNFYGQNASVIQNHQVSVLMAQKQTLETKRQTFTVIEAVTEDTPAEPIQINESHLAPTFSNICETLESAYTTYYQAWLKANNLPPNSESNELDSRYFSAGLKINIGTFTLTLKSEQALKKSLEVFKQKAFSEDSARIAA